MIKLTFKDGAKKEYAKGVKADDVVKDHFKKEDQKAVAAKINGKAVDLSRPLEESGEFEVITYDTPEGLEVIRHSSSHVMALAIKRCFPRAKVTIGPAVEDGFYYDFDNLDLKEEDFPKIEEEISKVLHEKLRFERSEVSRAEALKKFSHEPYKVEIIKDFEKGENISTYKLGEFEDLCRGPHVPSTGKIGAIKLMKLAGAYWRGDSKNKMLTRVYGTSFPDKKMMQEYLQRLEEAKKRDHRKLVQDLDLVYFHEYSPGAPFFLKKGAFIYNELINFIREEYSKRGYDEVITPQLYNKRLWENSGHWDHYKENMFIINIEGQEYSLKPMNCPSHCLIYNRSVRSYRDLPIRIADFCNLHRNEFSGTLTGLVRVRKFAQDDAHIFCRFDQIEDEVLGVLQFIKFVWEDVFHFKLEYYLSTKPENCLGTKETWDKAEALLKKALEKAGISYKVKPGEGAFYGPKIDIDVEDALGRKWQCPTCQLDFNLPHRFQTMYIDAEGKKQECVMIHRAVLGSLERFFGLLVEHYAGKFPLWLSPVQVKVLPISDKHVDYALKVSDKMRASGLRVEVDVRSESTSKKVRDAQLEKVNYILVVGDKEVEGHSVNIRTRNGEVKGTKKVDEFISELLAEVKEKAAK